MPTPIAARFSGQLVGRSTELQVFAQRLDELGGGRGGRLELLGDPGIGKTRLLHELLQRAERRGVRTCAGVASDFERDVPFAALRDALSGLVDEPSLERVGAAHAVELRSLLSTDPAAATRPERHRLHDAVAAYLSQLADERPLLVALDDVHWADPATREVLAYLLRHPVPGALLLAVTSRRALPGLVGARDALPVHGAVSTLTIGPLDRDAAYQLLVGLSPSARAQIFRESEGNPLYLEVLARAGATPAAPAAADHDDGALGVLGELVAGALDHVSPPARTVAHAAAVLGEQLDLDALAAVAELPCVDVGAAADELAAVDLVAPTHTGELRFRHPVMRRAVYAETPAGWRRAAHARAAREFARRGLPALVQAHHVERSSGAGDRHAIDTLTAAARQSAARAPATAARWYAAALRRLPDGPEHADRRLELLAGLASAHAAVGRLTESRNAIQELLARLDDDSPLWARTVGLAALVEELLGHHEEAQTLLLAALNETDNGDDRAELELELSLGCFFSTDWAGMRHRAYQARRTHPDPTFDATTAAATALGAYGQHDVPAARDAAQTAATLLDAVPDSTVAARLQALAWLAWAEYCLGRYPDAARHVHRALAIARETGQEQLIVAMLVVAAMAALAQGQLAAASRHAEDAVVAAELTATPIFVTWALTVSSMVELQGGELAMALTRSDQAVRAGRDSGGPWSAVADLYLAEAALESGDVKRAYRQLTTVDGSLIALPFPFYEIHALELLARAESEQGRAPGAAAWAQRATTLAAGLALPAEAAGAARAHANALLARGEVTAAAGAALNAARASDAAAMPLETAHAHALAGTALATLDPARAISELDHARSTYRTHGAARHERATVKALRRLGVHHAHASELRPQRTPSGALSPRQRDAATLVAEGLTNKQIAARLHVSTKAIESYLTSAYDKLGISSRRELAAWWHDHHTANSNADTGARAPAPPLS